MQHYSPPQQQQKKDFFKPRKLARSSSKRNSKAPSVLDQAVSQAYSIERGSDQELEAHQDPHQLPQIAQVGNKQTSSKLIASPSKQNFLNTGSRAQANILRINQSAIKFAQQAGDNRYGLRNNFHGSVKFPKQKAEQLELASSSIQKWISDKKRPSANFGLMSNPGIIMGHNLYSQNTTLQKSLLAKRSPDSRQSKVGQIHALSSIGNSMRSSHISLANAIKKDEILASELPSNEPRHNYGDSKIQLQEMSVEPTLAVPHTDPSPQMNGMAGKIKLTKEKPRHSLNAVYPSDLVKIAEQSSPTKETSLSPGMKHQTSNEAQLSIAKLCQSLKEKNLPEENQILSPPSIVNGPDRLRALNVKVPRRSDAKSELVAKKSSAEDEVQVSTQMTRNSKSILSSQRNPNPIIEVNESPSKSQASLPRSVAHNFIPKASVIDRKRQFQQQKQTVDTLPILSGKNIKGFEPPPEIAGQKKVSMTRTRYKFVNSTDNQPPLPDKGPGFQIQMMRLKSRERMAGQTTHSRLQTNRLIVKGTSSKPALPIVQQIDLQESGKKHSQPQANEAMLNLNTIKDTLSASNQVLGTNSVESRNSDRLNSNRKLGIEKLPKYNSQGRVEFKVVTQSVQEHQEQNDLIDSPTWKERKNLIAISPFTRKKGGGEIKDFDLELKKLAKKKKKKAAPKAKAPQQAANNQASTGNLGATASQQQLSTEQMHQISLFQNQRTNGRKQKQYNSQNPQEASINYNDDSSLSGNSKGTLKQQSIVTSRVEKKNSKKRKTSRGGGEWGYDDFIHQQEDTTFNKQSKLEDESPMMDESLLDFQQYVKYKEKSPSKPKVPNHSGSAKNVLKLYKFRSSISSGVDSALKKRTFRSPVKYDSNEELSQLEEKDFLTPMSPGKRRSNRVKRSTFKKSATKREDLSPTKSEGSSPLMSPSLKSPLQLKKKQSVLRSPVKNWWEYQIPLSKKNYTSIPTLQAIYGGQSEVKIIAKAGFNEPPPVKKPIQKKEKKVDLLDSARASQIEREARLERLKQSKLIDVRNEGMLEPQRKAIERIQRHNQMMEQMQLEEAKRDKEMMRRLRIRQGKGGADEEYDEEYDDESPSYYGESDYSPA